MKHPRDREERRAVRYGYIARRKFIAQRIWRDFNQAPHEGSPWYMREPGWYQEQEWGRYAKFNLNCTCWMCHYQKHDEKRQRRRALDQALIDNIASWE